MNFMKTLTKVMATTALVAAGSVAMAADIAVIGRPSILIPYAAATGDHQSANARGLDHEIKEMGEGLSVGQRQSMGWARLWLQDPAVVILDEPTAALDQTLEATLVSRLKGWLEGRTAIIATHRIPILQLTTRTLILQNGRLAVDGPRDAVLAHLARSSS